MQILVRGNSLRIATNKLAGGEVETWPVMAQFIFLTAKLFRE